MTKAAKFREMLFSPELEFLCEAHNGISAKIVEEAGFKGIWGSGLTIAAAMGVRDANEASWTQILEVLEFIGDITHIPLLLDADTGYGNFNNVRRLVKKLEQRGVAAMCIEDKLFPKTNSLLEGGRQELADIDEFCGKIKAAKDAQMDPDFSVIARVEAFIAGHGLQEALTRATAYHAAGADGIFIHSKLSSADEVLTFKKEWGNRAPVIIVPTKYYRTLTEIFREAGFSMVIWANMVLRSAIAAMQETTARLAREQSLIAIDDRLATVSEVFRLQGAEELERAEQRYLPVARGQAQALILAASRGEEFSVLTESTPKAMLAVAGKPLLYHQVDMLREIGVRDITVVRGFCKEKINAPNLSFVDNDEYASTKEVASLAKGIERLANREKTLVTYGDLLYKKYIPTILLEAEGDIVIAADPEWRGSRQKGRYMDFVSCSEPYRKTLFGKSVALRAIGPVLPEETICGEWFGLLALSARGLRIAQEILRGLSVREGFAQMRPAAFFSELMRRGHTIRVVYVNGHWLDIDELKDFSDASAF